MTRAMEDSVVKYKAALLRQNTEFANLIGLCRFDDNGMDLTKRIAARKARK